MMLRNVLICYVKRNPTIGYCQGLNFVVAQLLRYMNEEEAFWTLSAIIESVLPLDYYLHMIGILVDKKIFTRLMKRLLPVSWEILKKFSINPHIVIIQWIVCLYSQNIQPEVTDCIWDHWLLEGKKILFKSGLGMFLLLEKDLERCNDLCILFN